MIMSAIFIETFFSTCGACASADAVNASESIAMARNFPINDMFSSLSERSSWRDLRLQHHSDLDISPSPLGAINLPRKLDLRPSDSSEAPAGCGRPRPDQVGTQEWLLKWFEQRLRKRSVAPERARRPAHKPIDQFRGTLRGNLQTWEGRAAFNVTDSGSRRGLPRRMPGLAGLSFSAGSEVYAIRGWHA